MLNGCKQSLHLLDILCKHQLVLTDLCIIDVAACPHFTCGICRSVSFSTQALVPAHAGHRLQLCQYQLLLTNICITDVAVCPP